MRTPVLFLLFLTFAVAGCSHDIAIYGEGDVLSASGDRSCSLEDTPCAVSIGGHYLETYTALPRDPEYWAFDRWENCPTSVGNVCNVDVPQDIMEALYLRDFGFALEAHFVRVKPPQFIDTNPHFGDEWESGELWPTSCRDSSGPIACDVWGYVLNPGAFWSIDANGSLVGDVPDYGGYSDRVEIANGFIRRFQHCGLPVGSAFQVLLHWQAGDWVLRYGDCEGNLFYEWRGSQN